MPKKLVIFCDGTWNEPVERGTNIVRMLQATEHVDANGVPQIVYYIAGVGTRRKDERLWGGAFGMGISDNIKDAYAFIVSNYENGDDIYLFGFSRGAYTARSIAGLIHNLGVLHRYNLRQVAVAYEYYKDKTDPWKPDGEEAREFRKKYCNEYPASIRFLGLWDTVGALGAPYGEVVGRILARFFKIGFHDVTLSSSVRAAAHAISADERRWPFRPTPVEITQTHSDRNAENIASKGFPLYTERWFPGVHSNVGGGYEDYGLSDYALGWIAERAQENGLAIRNLAETQFAFDMRPFKPDPTEPIKKSQTWMYRLATALMVKAPAMVGLKSVYPEQDQKLTAHVTPLGDYIRPIPPGADVSALTEKQGVDGTYRPENLPPGAWLLWARIIAAHRLAWFAAIPSARFAG